MHLHRLSSLPIYIAFIGIAGAQSPSVVGCPVLPADNIWNTPVDQLPVSSNTTAYVNTIGATVGIHADFGSGLWDGGPIGIPFITVPGTQTKYPAAFQYASESDPGPYATPLNAPIEGGSQSTGDRHVISVDINNCILYELYSAFPQAASWTAGSGVIFNLLSNSLRPSGWTSTDAAGLPIFPGLARYDEIAAGQINHALRFTVPQTQKAFVWPARHFASSLTGAQFPPMGTRFRLRANFDITSFSPANQIILKALKKYGMMIADNGSSWYLSGAPDSRWNNTELHDLGRIKGSDFEVVDVSGLMISANSGQARQSGSTGTVSVSVAPGSASVQVNTSKQFTATVQNSANQAVTWSVNGIVGGNSTVGTINATGFFVAPASAPSPATVTVQAASQASPTAVGAATVTITAPSQPVSVTISPITAVLRFGQTKTFVATVSNSSNSSVVWKVNGITGGSSKYGFVSSLGTYKAPGSVPSGNTVQVTAVSVADPTKSASATVTISRR